MALDIYKQMGLNSVIPGQGNEVQGLDPTLQNLGRANMLPPSAPATDTGSSTIGTLLPLITAMTPAGAGIGAVAGAAGGTGALSPILTGMAGPSGGYAGLALGADTAKANMPQSGSNPMALASMLGLIAGAIDPKGIGGRVGMAASSMANGQITAQALLEREKGQRDFLMKLLKANQEHNQMTNHGFGQSFTTQPDTTVK